MTIIATDEILGIPRADDRPLKAAARLALFIALGLVAAALLFLLDSVLVKRAVHEKDAAVPVKLVPFVRVEDTNEIRIKERRLPPKPKPVERPEPPDQLKTNQRKDVQQMEIDFEMPDVDSNFAGGAGPWLGAYVPRRSTRGMHDGDVLPVVRIEPQYPREALVKGIEGWVRVEFVILEDGGVQSVEVLAAEPPGMFERPG